MEAVGFRGTRFSAGVLFFISVACVFGLLPNVLYVTFLLLQHLSNPFQDHISSSQTQLCFQFHVSIEHFMQL